MEPVEIFLKGIFMDKQISLQQISNFSKEYNKNTENKLICLFINIPFKNISTGSMINWGHLAIFLGDINYRPVPKVAKRGIMGSVPEHHNNAVNLRKVIQKMYEK